MEGIPYVENVELALKACTFSYKRRRKSTVYLFPPGSFVLFRLPVSLLPPTVPMKLLSSVLSFTLCIVAVAAANCGSARSSSMSPTPSVRCLLELMFFLSMLETTSKLTGPNGHIDYLNCGLEAGGWTPPKLHINNVATKSLSAALQSKSSPFKACGRYVSTFEKYGAKYGIPPIFLAAFAMQESSCNANTVGGGGEQGLMQITREKCKGSPGGNCKDAVCSNLSILVVLGPSSHFILCLLIYNLGL